MQAQIGIGRGLAYAKSGGETPLSCLPAAAEFVKQVVPVAGLRYFDGGHFVLDENADAIAEAIIGRRDVY